MTPNLSPLELCHRQMAMERIGVNDAGLLYRLPGENPDEIGRVKASLLTTGEYVAYFRDDLPPNQLERLRSMTPRQVYEDEEAVLAILGVTEPGWRGRTSIFSSEFSTRDFELVSVRDGRFIVQIGTVRAAEAWASRATDQAAELAVETQPDFQRRGYGRQVCAAWANHALAAGRTAYYSHSVLNTASRALADNLGVQHFMDNVSYG